MIGTGVKVINESLSVDGHDNTNATSYDCFEKYTDYLIANMVVTIVCATANSEEDYITSPALSKYTENSVKDSQKWILQAVCYMRGDVNKNGKIDDTDRSIVLQIAAQIGANGTTSYNNISVFLGDYDDNGKINSSDATLIAANKT